MALAMLAGWHAEVPVIGGAMTTKLVESTDPNEWLSVVLTEPSARMVLMNPDASHIAGAFFEGSGRGGRGFSGLVVTYETLNPAYRDQSIESLRLRWELRFGDSIRSRTFDDRCTHVLDWPRRAR